MCTCNVNSVGVVIIGRNEGERLKRCIQSVLPQTNQIVYVDSGSVDQSVKYAQEKMIDVVELDRSLPFSAGRARNEGFDTLLNKYSNLKYIQFVDGDCELDKGWLAMATEYMTNNKSCAIVVGEISERYPTETIYNLLCDIEWKKPLGEITACGGIFLVRAAAFKQVQGFNSTVIAGEEPELCYRLRKKDWKVYNVGHKMAFHDADMHYFEQWWRRSIRSGHAYAQGVSLHGHEGEQFCVRNSLRIWLWAAIFPIIICLLAGMLTPYFFLFFFIYPIQFIRIAVDVNKRLQYWRHSALYALFTVIGK